MSDLVKRLRGLQESWADAIARMDCNPDLPTGIMGQIRAEQHATFKAAANRIEDLGRQLEDAEKELDAVYALLPGTYYMDPPDGGDVEQLEQMRRMAKDAGRYRFLAEECRSTSEHWGGRWSIVIEGPAPASHDSEDDFGAAIDAAMQEGEQ